MPLPARKGRRSLLQTMSLPPPMGGVNTVDVASMMPLTDCIYCYNLIAAELGLRSRLGYSEFGTGLLDKDGNAGLVKTIIPFAGSKSDGSSSKLFATTNEGIYDCSNSGIAGTVDWQATTNYDVGDRVLSDSGKTYVFTIPDWTPGATYVAGQQVKNTQDDGLGNTVTYFYICTVGGVAAAVGPGPTGTGTGIVDNLATWDYEATTVAGTSDIVAPTGTSTGITDGTVNWDYSAAPVKVFTFPTKTGDAGLGIFYNFVTFSGHWGLYTDETNGLILYNESKGKWYLVYQASASAWINGHGYTQGDFCLNGGNTYICTTTGTSAGAGGPTGTDPDADIVDNTAHWNYVYSISGVNPRNLVSVTAWKHRLAFTEKDSARAWYLGTDSVIGAATRINFGTKFRAGGHLVGLWSWTGDGGAGMDDKVVAISGGGDVAIYAGDGFAATNFALQGAWFVGGVPKGRRIATDFGGDMLVLSTLGVLPLSKLVIGNPIVDRSQYITHKVSNLLNVLMSLYRTLDGWSIRVHPEDNTLLITFPVEASQPTQQLAMSLPTKSWSQYRDLPIYSSESWGGQFYFGTIDGRICKNSDYVDNVKLSDPNAAVPVSWSLLTSFQNLKNGKQKRVHEVRTTILSQQAPPSYELAVKFRYDFREPDSPVAIVPSSGGVVWDAATWDSVVWGGEFTPTQGVVGGAGMAPEFALAIRGTATSRTVLLGFDLAIEQGGFL